MPYSNYIHRRSVFQQPANWSGFAACLFKIANAKKVPEQQDQQRVDDVIQDLTRKRLEYLSRTGTSQLCETAAYLLGKNWGRLPQVLQVPETFLDVPVQTVFSLSILFAPSNAGHFAKAITQRSIRIPPGITAIQAKTGLKPARLAILQNGTTNRTADAISHGTIPNSFIFPPAVRNSTTP
jgi:hypothetical protein